MTEHLSALDATFLELEESDASAHMHIGGILVFDPLPGGGVPSVEQVRRQLTDRLGLLPRYRQRLSEPRTHGLRWPAWVDDPGFDPAAHVKHAALPAPGGRDELCEWAADYWSRRLDRDRPLWDAYLLEGLEGGRWAIATKTHHALVDGVGSVDVGHLLLDVSPDGDGPRPDAPVPAHHAEGVLEQIGHAARDAAGAVLHPRRTLEAARAMAELVVRDELVAAPHSSLNSPIGGARRFRVVHVPLSEVKGVKRALGGTVNDVVLAACSGGLRKLLVERGEEPPAGVRAMVPVNLRASSQELALGNRITSLFVPLPVEEPDPRQRYERAMQSAESLKSGTQALGGSTLVGLTSLAPPAIHAFLARSLFASRLFNVTITNVPGPPVTLYAFGAPMREILPLVPPAADHCVGMCIVSYDGTLYIGVVADWGTVPDVDMLADGIAESFHELVQMADDRVAALG
jgi:WS/DGAT/MGAT family acyltransferase